MNKKIWIIGIMTLLIISAVIGATLKVGTYEKEISIELTQKMESSPDISKEITDFYVQAQEEQILQGNKDALLQQYYVLVNCEDNDKIIRGTEALLKINEEKI
jgi:hypothetical protein